MSKLLDLYKTWSKTDKNGNKVPIGKPGQYIAGTENTANGQAVDFLSTEKSLIGKNVIPGFIPHRKKYQSDYPITDDKTLEIARVEETGGTHNVPRFDVNNKFTDSFIRE